MKILILAPYPLKSAPSQRFRFEHYFKFMEEKGIEWHFQSFLSEWGWKIVYSPGKSLLKASATILGYLRRILILFSVFKYQYIFIHRELTPFGPPIFEWIVTQLFIKKVIYDFDDAIWLADRKAEASLWRILKWRSKVSSICKWSHKVSTGNSFLADFASQFCQNVKVIPTVVDTSAFIPQPSKSSQMPIIGWTGSHSTLPYLEEVLPPLQQLENVMEFEFVVIANKNPELPLENFRFVKWSKDSEVADLAHIDIGLMPLPNDEWSKGKCGFKLIQYLSIGIPAVAAPVGVNTEIIKNEETGFLASTNSEWIDGLKTLLENPETRKKMGANGRKLIEENYSVNATKEDFINLFKTS